MVLTGNFSRTVDDKLRLAIPKEIRETLNLGPTGALYVAPGTDGSLSLYTEEEFSKLAELLSASSPTQKDVRAFGRLFYAQAQRAELDRQGRIRIPPELAQQAALKKDVVLLGVQNHLELWDRERWEAYFATRSLEYDAIAEAAFGAGRDK